MLYFTGDINLTDWMFNVGFGIGAKIQWGGVNPLVDINLHRNDNDLWIGNFEGVASSVSANKGIYAKAFRIEPDALRKLHHLDFYGFANNHAMEHGPEAYKETVKALESYGSKVFGRKDARTIAFEHQGQKCTITGMCLRIEDSKYEPLYWYNPEYKEIEEEIAKQPKDAFKILYVHWGNEYINRPSAAQKKFAHWLIDAGFDLIIGMHPHVLQGYEDYKSKRIYYSLGNCVFDMPSEQCKIGAIVGLDFKDGKPAYTEEYLKIDDECCPHLASEKEIPQQWRFEHLNECLKKDVNSEQYHQEVDRGYRIYRKANRVNIIKNVIKHPISGMSIIFDFVKRRLLYHYVSPNFK